MNMHGANHRLNIETRFDTMISCSDLSYLFIHLFLFFFKLMSILYNREK